MTALAPFNALWPQAFVLRSPGRAVFRRVFEDETAVGYGLEDGKDLFCLKLRPDAVVPGAGFHLAFSAPSRSAVDTFHQSALRIGGQDNGKPGLRSNYARTTTLRFSSIPMATESKRLQRCRLNKHRHRAKRGEVFRATATRHGTRVILLGGEKGLSLITPDEREVTAPPPLGLRARHTKEQGTFTSASAARYGLLMRDIRRLQESHSTKRRKSLNNGGADGSLEGPVS
jgi:hypothetical protein